MRPASLLTTSSPPPPASPPAHSAALPTPAASPTRTTSSPPRATSPARMLPSPVRAALITSAPVSPTDPLSSPSQESPFLLAQRSPSPPPHSRLSPPLSPPPDSTQQAAARLFANEDNEISEPNAEPDAIDDGPGSFSQIPVGSLPSSFVEYLGDTGTGGNYQNSDAEVGGDNDDEGDDSQSQGIVNVSIGGVDDGNKAECLEDMAEWDSDLEDGYEEMDDEVVEFDPLTRAEPDSEDEAEEAAELALVDAAFLDSLGGAVNVASGKIDNEALRKMRWGPVTDQYDEVGEPSFPNLTTTAGGPRQQVIDVYDKPLALFFAFFPRSLWKMIAVESNRFERQTRGDRARALIAAQRRRREKDQAVVVEDIGVVRQRMRMTPPIEPWEIVRVIGLLVGNVVNTHHTGIYRHWSGTRQCGISAGSFGFIMSRNRFNHVLRHLHFSDNKARENTLLNDKAWKIRPVITVLQERFRRLWDLTSSLSFDEGVLPATSRRNPTRTYIKDKPHRWGTKLFMTCDAATGYCFRFEVYLSRKQHDKDRLALDNSTGPAAVVRNLAHVVTEADKANGWRVVTFDRYYTGVPLMLQLLQMKMYGIGTINANRIGYCEGVIRQVKKRDPKTEERGMFKVSRSLDVPLMRAIMWLDNNAVHFLSTGAVCTESTVNRTPKHGGPKQPVVCPQVVRDYHEHMGGVDRHDQLRLQRYSLQMSFRCKKYYKALFLGLVDLVIVNAFVTHLKCAKDLGQTPLSRASFMQSCMSSYLLRPPSISRVKNS